MIRKEECKHKQLIQYQSYAPQCQDCGVYMVTRKRNPLSSKSFFDFSEEEQKEILNQAADDSNKAQQELMDTEEQVCTCGMEPCDPKCKACPLFHVHTPLLDKPFNIEKFKKAAAKVRATFDTEEQVCKEIPGFKGYFLNAKGELFTTKHKLPGSRNNYVFGEKVRMTLNPDIQGYLATTFWNNGKPSKCRIHRLVALTFIPNPDKKTLVLHRDGNKLNNTIENLYWGSHRDNMADMLRHGTHKSGFKGWFSKICPCHCHVFCPGSISFQEAGDIKAMCSCSPQECIHCTPLLDTDEGYYDSTMHWHTGKPPTKGNTPEIPDSSEAWEERFDGLMYNENGTTPTEIKTLIHTLLKHKESMTLQTVREKVEALPKLVTPDFNDAPLLNRHDVLKLLERR